MRLSVIGHSMPPSREHVLALFAGARAEFLSLGLRSEVIDLGLAICTPALSRLHNANILLDARVPVGGEAPALWRTAQEHFARAGTRVRNVVFASDATDAERSPLVALLGMAGWREHHREVLRLTRAVESPEPIDLSILSARAALRPYEAFARAVAVEEPQLAELAMLRLDDPRFDALVVLADGRVLARAGVLALGEVGLIENVVVRPDCRGRGLGRAVMRRAIDLCARAQFRHVLLGCAGDNAPAQALYVSLGFTRIGTYVEWRAPAEAEDAAPSMPA